MVPCIGTGNLFYEIICNMMARKGGMNAALAALMSGAGGWALNADNILLFFLFHRLGDHRKDLFPEGV